jgi:hypothetical protein
MSDFEQRLARLRMVEPGEHFEFHALNLMRSSARRPRKTLQWAIAASLVLSLSFNAFLVVRQSQKSDTRSEAGPHSATTQTQDVYVPGADNAPRIRVKEYSS